MYFNILNLSGEMVNTVHLKWTAVWLRGSSPLLDKNKYFIKK